MALKYMRRKNVKSTLDKCNALLSRDPALFFQPCRLTMKLIQIGTKGGVQPFDTGQSR